MAVLVGKRAPSFEAPAVVDSQVENAFSLDRYLGKQHVVLFFYPADFSSLCPTELWAFEEMLPEFARRGVAVVGCSTDSVDAHGAWLRTPRAEGGIAGLTFPLVADASKTIAANYDMLAGHFDYNEQGEMTIIGQPTANRGLFLIDRDGIVRHQVVNDGPLGRSTTEALRMVDALQHYEQHGSLCPADWREGEAALNPRR